MEKRFRLSALAHIKWGKTTLEVLPLRVLCWALLILASVSLLFFTFDKTLVTAQEGGLLYQSMSWDAEDERILKNIFERVYCDPLMRLKHWRKPSIEKSKTRILVVGDSYIFGDGLSNFNDTYWMQLRRRLQEFGYRDIEVLAIGECGWGTKQAFEALRPVAPKFNPDLIIWAYVPNDPDEKAYKQAENDEAWAEYHSSLPKSDLWYNLCEHLSDYLPRLSPVLSKHRHEALIARTPPPAELGYQYCSWVYKLYSPENLKRYEKTLKKVADFSKAHKTPHLFVGLTRHHLLDDRFFVKTISELFKKYSLPFIDLGPGLEQMHLQRFGKIPPFDANPSNGHPNRFATRPYADLTIAILEKSYSHLLPKKASFEPSFAINDWVPHDLKVESQEGEKFTFTYPEVSNPLVLQMPFERPYVQLNFEFPVELSSVGLRSINMTHSFLDYTIESLQEQRVRQLGKKSGKELVWSFPDDGKRVRTIRLSSTFAAANSERKVELFFQLRNQKDMDR